MATIDQLLESARARLRRVTPDELSTAQASGAVVVDIRPVEQRNRDGELPGALIIDRNVLEWRLAPSSDHRVVDAADRVVIVVCNEGYSSSLAAATLQDLGVPGATDLIGGFQAWKAQAYDGGS